MGLGRGEHNAVGKSQLRLHAQFCGLEGEAIIEVHDDPSPHCCNHVQGLLPSDVSEHMAIDLEHAERWHEQGISRSELYSSAVAEYLAKYTAEDVTQKLNEVYGEEPSGLPPELLRAQARSIGTGEW